MITDVIDQGIMAIILWNVSRLLMLRGREGYLLGGGGLARGREAAQVRC